LKALGAGAGTLSSGMAGIGVWIKREMDNIARAAIVLETCAMM
jgi:hypothetical protein